MEKRYQVFVSSTFEDLKDERKAAIEGLLNADMIPAGMEMFYASTDEQFQYIKKVLDYTDYYVLIIGGRYGTINSALGISYTEQEYDYAFSIGIPILIFMHANPSLLPSNKQEQLYKDKYQNFRQKVSQNRMCKTWSNITELTSSIIISLNKIIQIKPRPGWIRGEVENEFDFALPDLSDPQFDIDDILPTLSKEYNYQEDILTDLPTLEKKDEGL